MAASGKKSMVLRGTVFVLAVAGLFVLFRVLPVTEWLGMFLDYVQSLGLWGPVILGAAYVVATVAMIPAWILTVGSGFVFGVVKGTIIVSISSTLGATAAFVVGRTFARGWVEKIASRNPKFAAVDRAVEAHGFKIVLLTRLSPVFPFNVLNYLFSLTSVRLRDYVLASWIGMFPGTLMYVYFGTAFKNLAEVVAGDIEGGVAQRILFAVGLAVTVIVTIYVTRIARRAIRQYVDTEGPAGPETPPTPEITS